MKGQDGIGGILHLPDSLGYVFFSSLDLLSIAGPTGVGRYVTLDGVDPIQSSYTNGQLPTCIAPCPVTPGTSFPHIRDGSYRAWTIVRVVTDASGPNLANAQTLVTQAQSVVNSTVPDFVPFGPTPDAILDCSISARTSKSPASQKGRSPTIPRMAET